MPRKSGGGAAKLAAAPKGKVAAKPSSPRSREVVSPTASTKRGGKRKSPEVQVPESMAHNGRSDNLLCCQLPSPKEKPSPLEDGLESPRNSSEVSFPIYPVWHVCVQPPHMMEK